jgi:RNA polymerase primary sigma factor
MDACRCSREDIERLLAAEKPSRGLDEPSGAVDGPGETLCERLADETSGDDFERVLDREPLEDLRSRCDALSDRERRVVSGHFGLAGPPCTLRELAKEFSLSIERVRQIEEGALDKLRDGLTRVA